MSIENARKYLINLKNNIEDEGEEKEKISASALVYILTKFLETLQKDENERI